MKSYRKFSRIIAHSVFLAAERTRVAELDVQVDRNLLRRHHLQNFARVTEMMSSPGIAD